MREKRDFTCATKNNFMIANQIAEIQASKDQFNAFALIIN